MKIGNWKLSDWQRNDVAWFRVIESGGVGHMSFWVSRGVWCCAMMLDLEKFESYLENWTEKQEIEATVWNEEKMKEAYDHFFVWLDRFLKLEAFE